MKEELFKVNSYYEGLIQNLYGGSKGCFSAFMQFFYQYNQIKVFQEEYAECLKQLFTLELENCETLSELLIRMGGDNKYYSSSRKFLSGYNVDYIKNFKNMFLSDIELLEINQIELKSIIGKIENQSIKNELKKIYENKKNELKILKENYFKNNIL